MHGNLAPDTAVAKPAAIAPEVRHFEGTAICFSGEDEANEAIGKQLVKPGHVVVIRYAGPKGAPGMPEMFKPMKLLYGQGLNKCTALITDGRFSGTNNGCFVGHISPEAASGGPIALIEDGDHKLNRLVAIKVLKEEFCNDSSFVAKFKMEAQAAALERRIDLLVSDGELERRRAAFRYTPPPVEGYLARYARDAKSADQGGILE